MRQRLGQLFSILRVSKKPQKSLLLVRLDECAYRALLVLGSLESSTHHTCIVCDFFNRSKRAMRGTDTYLDGLLVYQALRAVQLCCPGAASWQHSDLGCFAIEIYLPVRAANKDESC